MLYANWVQIGETGAIRVGQGYTKREAETDPDVSKTTLCRKTQ
jgi:hypothetical protein